MKTARRKKSQNPASVTLIGLGNWGTSLAAALFSAGIPICEIVLRASSAQSQRLAKKLGARLATLSRTGSSAAQLDADILWICTPDAAIASTARELAAHRLQHSRSQHSHPIVFHSSGALSSAELAALRNAGASVASVHPLMTFPHRRPTSLAGVPFAIEGDARAVHAARRLVRQIGGQPFTLHADQKASYHAYATFTSPLLTALLAATQAAGRAAGLSSAEALRRMQPIVERTVANFFAERPAQSLSGPVARGDTATVASHLATLASHPELQQIYRALQSFAVTALPGKQKPALRKLLSK